jgi:hypothetical protein
VNQQQRPVRRGKVQAKRTRLVVAAVAAVIVVGAAIAVFAGGSDTKKQPVGASAASIIAAVTSVPAQMLDTVGIGAVKALPVSVSGTAITADGKPEVLYIGAEFCPYCAAERWAMVVALSRFGTFTGLGFTHSSTSDVFADTQTFSFHGSSFSSSYVSFTGVETTTNEPNGNGGYVALEAPTADQLRTWQELDPRESFPFIDVGGKYLVSGASFDPGVLADKTAGDIATALTDPTSAIAQAVLGTANALTAAICSITAGQPAAVCLAPGVAAVRLG